MKLSREKFFEFIDGIQFFDDFTAEEKKVFSNLGSSMCCFPDGDYILREGSMDLMLYILIKGKAIVTRKENPDTPIATLTRGAVFGEVAFVNQSPRHTNVIALGETYAMKLDGELIREKFDKDLQTKFLFKLINLLIQRLDTTNMTLSNLIR